MIHIAHVGLGGNVDGPVERIRAAVAGLRLIPQTQVQAVSSLFRSAAWGLREQPDFINAVARLSTSLDAVSLLGELRRQEDAVGRQRDVRWGPRTLDLDLLLYDDLQLESDLLTLPHPRMHLRAFVLMPLLEVDPGAVIPGRGSALTCLDALPVAERNGVAVVAE